MRVAVESMKNMEIIEPGFTIKSSFNESQREEFDALVRQIAEAVR